ncbi:putative p22 protein precursor [Trypanosoma vivax]|nr:putative p22 protein precursor [Trypanosoma vivax]
MYRAAFVLRCGRIAFNRHTSRLMLVTSQPPLVVRQAHSYSRRFTASNGAEQGSGETPESSSSSLTSVSGSVERRRALPPSDYSERSFLKCIEKEIEDEALRLDKEEGPPPPPNGWEMYHAPGTSVFYGRRWWVPPSSVCSAQEKTATTENQEARDIPPPRAMECHTVRVQLTTRDPSLDPECDVRGEHFPFSLFVQRVTPVSAPFSMGSAEERNLYNQSIEVRADFVDGELVVDNVVFHGKFKSPIKEEEQIDGVHEREVGYDNNFNGYPGPNLDEAEEEILDGIQAWLAERCVDDQFGEFIGQYSVWVEQQEYERWLRRLRDFVAA